jgi:hypothetical protein
MNNDCDMMIKADRPIKPMSPYLLPKRNRAAEMPNRTFISKTVNALSISI